MSMPRFRRYFLRLLILLSFTNLSACGRPEVTPPPIEPVISDYIRVLHSGNLEQVEQLYFVPLHWRHKEKMFEHFRQDYELIKQNKLRLRSISVNQKGRWALSVIESNREGKTHIRQLWFFYYDGRWQAISPVIFGTGPVRAMMDLYREHDDLRLWYKDQQSKSDDSSEW